MHSKGRALTGLLVFLLSLSALGASQEQGARFEGAALLEPAKAALEVPRDDDGRLQLTEVLARFQEVTDWTVLIDDQTRRLVETASVFSSGPLRAEPADVLPVVEAVMKHSKFVFTLVREDPPRILALHSLDTQARSSVREDAIYVPIKEVPRFADHSAILIETVITLPNTDVRALSNVLRGMVVDPNLLQIVPVGSSTQLILQGFGDRIATLVEMLRTIDAWSAPGGEEVGARSRPPQVLRAKGETVLPAEGEQNMTLFELVQTFAEKTNATVLVSEETTRLLETTRLGLGVAMTVPGADLSTMVEELLIQNNYVVTTLRSASPALFAVLSLDTTARTGARQDASYVDSGSIADCTARPATTFQTVIHLPHTDVRTLSKSTYGMVVDPTTLQIVPAGNSSSLILQSRGRQLVRISAMFAQVDADEAARPKPVEPESQEAPPGAGGK